MDKISDNFSHEDILRIAHSPAGQQLIALMRQKGGRELQDAIQQASGGDYGKAKASINQILSTPEAKALLEQLGGKI